MAKNEWKFLQSVYEMSKAPLADRPELLVAGRSNSGKSTLINALANQKLARTSSKPGLTEALNFYAAGTSYFWVDSPGYGFAVGGRSRRQSWERLMADYFHSQRQLKCVVLVMDIRRSWAAEEAALGDLAQASGADFVVALSKADKLSYSQIVQKCKSIGREAFATAVMPVSAMKGNNIADLKKLVLASIHTTTGE